MNLVKIKRIYEVPSSNDGYRMLIDRLWPRGLKKENANLDEWNKEIAPSTELRKWFDHDPAKFEEFSKRYLIELENKNKEVLRLLKLASEQPLTLLYAAKDPQINQAIVLLTAINKYENHVL